MSSLIVRRLNELTDEIASLEADIRRDSADETVSDLWFATEVDELVELQEWRAAIFTEHLEYE